MTDKEAVNLLLLSIENVCYADNIHDDDKRQEAIFRLAGAHQKVMRETDVRTETNNGLAWFWCWIGVHWCTPWSNPDDDEDRRYQNQRCLRCNKVWERRIPVR